MRSMIARRGGPPSRTVSPPLRGHRGARGDAPDPLNRSGDPQSPNMNTAWSVPNGAKSALGTIYEEAGAGAGAGAEAGTKAWTMTIEATDGHGNNNVDNDDDTNNTMATTATTKQQRQKWQYNGNNNEEATTIAKQQWKRQQRTTTTQQRHGAATAAHKPQRQRRQLQQLTTTTTTATLPPSTSTFGARNYYGQSIPSQGTGRYHNPYQRCAI